MNPWAPSLLTISALLAGACSAGSPLQAGNWETTSRMADGTERTMTRCISEPEASDPAAGVLSGALWSQCSVLEGAFASGLIDIQAQCFSQRRGPASAVPGTSSNRVRFEGRHSPVSFEGRVSMTPLGEAGTTGTISGRRLGDCPLG